MATCMPPSSPASHFPYSKRVSEFDMYALPTCMLSSPAHTPSSHPLYNNSSRHMPSIKHALEDLKGENPLDNLLPVLQNCIESKNLSYAKLVHLHICNHGLEQSSKIINYIVPMFVGCGAALDAQQALYRSAHCNEYSWTCLIQGFIDCGDTAHALNLYQNMQENSVNPNEYTFVVLLKACTKQRWIERGWELHSEIAKMGIDDLFLGNTLVGMYAKCGAPLDSQNVFGQLPVKDVVSWNALLTGYSEHGWIKETLTCIEEMESQGVCPDCITYTCGLKACSSTEGALKKGQALHVEIIKKGIEGDGIVGNALVGMYAKSGALVEAHKVFDELAAPDEIARNALLSGYVENGYFEEVLRFSTQMQDDGILTDTSMFVCSLKVCGIMEAENKGRELHTELVKRGCDNDDFVGSTLVGMYAKCNLLADARKVFDQVTVRDLVCWTALISGYAECGLGEEALECYEQMQADHVCPCALLFSCTLKACCNVLDLSRGRELHLEIVKKGCEKDSFIGSTLVDMYAKCGSLGEAQQVFDNLLVHDAVTWTALIAGYVEYGYGEEALKCLDCMEAGGVSPDSVMLVASLKACASTGSLHRGRALHADVARRGLEKEDFIGIALVDMYGKCGFLIDANMVFTKLVSRDVVSWNAMIAGYAGHGFLEEALSSLREMQLAGFSPDIISWNSIIMGYAEQGESKESYSSFVQMQEQGLLPDDVIFLSVLKACGNMSSLQIGKRIHAHVCGVYGGVVSSESNVSVILIEMYSKCGSMDSAQELFNAFTSRHIRMWDVLIRGYTRQAEFGIVSELLRKMTTDGIPPDEVLFLNVLNVCAHMGLVEMGKNCFHEMTKEYGITPTFKHHTCMVSLLCRAGQLDEAAVMIEQMPLSPNLVVLCCMLDACWKWGNVELGRWAFERAMRLGGLDSSPFVLMSNIYSDAGMYDAAKSIDDLRLKWAYGKTKESFEVVRKDMYYNMV
eukprot:c22481_g3_i1 orf=155-3055(+)